MEQKNRLDTAAKFAEPLVGLIARRGHKKGRYIGLKVRITGEIVVETDKKSRGDEEAKVKTKLIYLGPDFRFSISSMASDIRWTHPLVSGTCTPIERSMGNGRHPPAAELLVYEFGSHILAPICTKTNTVYHYM